MQIEEVKISDISNHQKNPKVHPDKQIRLIEKSMKRFGWTNPVLLSADGIILAGHARVKAAIEQGMDTVPCIRTKLSGKEADAYLLADNRLSDIAPYNKDILAELLGELPDELAELTGFDTDQIDSLINGTDVAEAEKYISDKVPDFKPISEDDVPRLDEKKKVCCPECGHEFTP